MLITHLGKTRTRLLNSFKDLTDEQLNLKPYEKQWSIAQVVHHLYSTEKATALLILDALQTKSKMTQVAERDLSFLTDPSRKVKTDVEPPDDFFTKETLIQLLEESRFQYLQDVFNETHERTLTEKSMEHPSFGQINLKNLVDFIWLHEQRHIEQINEIKESHAIGGMQNARTIF